MLMYGLTDKGNILKLKVVRRIRDGEPLEVITKAIVLNTENSEFSVTYKPSKNGTLILSTVTPDPKELFDKLSKTRIDLEKKELAFMTNLFMINEDNNEFTNDDSSEELNDSDENNGD